MKILLYIALFALGAAVLASIVTAASYWLVYWLAFVIYRARRRGK